MNKILQQNPNIPLEILLNPLLLKIKKFLDDTYNFNIFDFDFFKTIVEHKKLTLNLSIKIGKLFAWMAVK